MKPRAPGVRFLRGLLAGFAAIAGSSVAIAEVTVELVDGTNSAGTVAKLTDAAVEIGGADGSRSIGVREVRSITWKTDESVRPRPVRVEFLDGSVIEGDDLVVSDKAAAVVRDGRSVAIPRDAIAVADFRRSGGDGKPAEPPAWLDRLQESGQERESASDVVVVGSADGPEFVECAIVGVAADAVTVVLDEETIPVKRSKVIGLRWLRDRDGADGEVSTPPVAVVDIDGGRLLATRVVIEGDEASIGLGEGEPIRVAAASLRRVDYASGRTVSLVALAAERLEVEPWFGLFKSLSGVKGRFDPRRLAIDTASGSREGLRLLPRTVIEWRLPEHARSIAMTLSASSSVVTVAIDGRECYRGRPSSPMPVTADVDGGRRLIVTVDFPPTGPATGGPEPAEVVLIEPRVER